MGTFDIPQVEPEAKTTAVGGESLENIKRLKSGDGSFQISNGRLELRDSNGNIVILLDANG